MSSGAMAAKSIWNLGSRTGAVKDMQEPNLPCSVATSIIKIHGFRTQRMDPAVGQPCRDIAKAAAGMVGAKAEQPS
jgi:hypothetical protein